eukprot:1318056-Amorphochlora_amoeboformis.AAC.1
MCLCESLPLSFNVSAAPGETSRDLDDLDDSLSISMAVVRDSLMPWHAYGLLDLTSYLWPPGPSLRIAFT